MNGLIKNSEVQSQAGIGQRNDSATHLVQQLARAGLTPEECTCRKIVFSQPFFMFISLLFIVTVLGILTILYFWGEVFFVQQRREPPVKEEKKVVEEDMMET